MRDVGSCLTTGAAAREVAARDTRGSAYEFAKCISLYVAEDAGNFLWVASSHFLYSLATSAPGSLTTYEDNVTFGMTQLLDNLLLVVSQGAE